MSTSPPGGLVSSNGHAPVGRAPSSAGAQRGRRPVSWVWLVVLFELWFGTFVAADRMHGMPSLLVLVAGFVCLGVAGWRWGADSRDGQDWGPGGVP